MSHKYINKKIIAFTHCIRFWCLCWLLFWSYRCTVKWSICEIWWNGSGWITSDVNNLIFYVRLQGHRLFQHLRPWWVRHPERNQLLNHSWYKIWHQTQCASSQTHDWQGHIQALKQTAQMILEIYYIMYQDCWSSIVKYLKDCSSYLPRRWRIAYLMQTYQIFQIFCGKTWVYTAQNQ